MLWLRGIKTFLDGGMLTGSAYMREPWGVSKIYSIDDPEYRASCSSRRRSCTRSPSSRSRTACSSPPIRRATARSHALLDAYERINRDDFPVRDQPPVHHPLQLHEPGGDREDASAGRRREHAAGLALPRRATLRQQFGDERLATSSRSKRSSSRASSPAAAPTTCRRSAACARSIPTIRSSACGPRSSRQPRGAEEPLHPEESADARAGDPALHDQQRLPDVPGERRTDRSSPASSPTSSCSTATSSPARSTR